MTGMGSARETQRTGAFVLVWAMLRQIFALMASFKDAAGLEDQMVEAEMAAARALLTSALASDPKLAGLTVDDFDIQPVYTASGAFDLDVRLKAPVIAAQGAARRQYLLDLRHIRRVRAALAWRATLRNIPWFTRRMTLLNWRERTCANRARRSASHRRARTPGRAQPRVLIPPWRPRIANP